MLSSASGTDPESLGAYRVLGPLGSGAMGVAYRAIAPDGTVVALKVMRTEFSRDATYQARFELETRVARGLVHPHVVPVLDAGTIDGRTFLVQPLIDGISLAEHLRRSGPLAIDETVRLVEELAGGLDAIADLGFVHRDVKPENILLDRDLHAHLIDFGLAKDLDAVRQLTRPGQTLGSVDYMAPEQIENRAVSPATDVYALAGVAHTCLAGRPPFADHQPMKVMLAHLDAAPPDVSELRPEVPAEMAAVIVRGLAKDPLQRYPAAGALADALRAAARG